MHKQILIQGTSWGKWSASRPCCFTPGKIPTDTQRIGGLAGVPGSWTSDKPLLSVVKLNRDSLQFQPVAWILNILK